MTSTSTKLIRALALVGLSTSLATACTPTAQAMDARQIEQQYGVPGAFADSVDTPDGPLRGTLVPITLANGRGGHLFIPQRQPSDEQAVYLRDEQGLHPVALGDTASRDDLAQSARIVPAPPQAAPRARGRSWEREVLIIGGSAGAGTAIGALAGGKKGAAVGAAAGGVGGLVYDLLTRSKK